MSLHSHARNIRFESLEPRQMLAGDVGINVHNGRLEIDGDAANNNITIAAGAEAGSFVITGLDGTTVAEEGEAAAGEVTVTGVRSISVDLGDGSDTVALNGVSVRGRISIETGDGDDSVTIGSAVQDEAPSGALTSSSQLRGIGYGQLRGGVEINTGDGDDEVNFDSSSVSNQLKIDTGVGDDIVNVTAAAEDGSDDGGTATTLRSGSSLGGLRFGSSSALSLDTGDGDDTVNVDTTDLDGHVKIETGIGNDTVSLTGTSDATAEVASGQQLNRLFNGGLFNGRMNIRGGIQVDLGEGDDTANVENVDARALVIVGDDGIDTISVTGSTIGHLGVFSGEGDDNVSIVDSVFTSLGVVLDGGDDSLSTDGVTSDYSALIGGDGEDTHNVVSDSDLGRELIRGFELPEGVVNTALNNVRGLGNLFRGLQDGGLGRLRH